MNQSFDNRDGKIWLNGKLIDWKNANIHVLNHGLHYASSVFEGERAYKGKVFKSREHTERLFEAAKTMIPLGRPGTPQEAAGAIYMFCIPESNYVTGQILMCHGGGFGL